MFGSPRPVFTMPAASNMSRVFAAVPAAAAFARRASGALALAAVALPAYGAAHRAPAHAVPHAAVAASHSSPKHRTEAVAAGKHGSAHERVAPVHTASTSRGKERGRHAETADETAAGRHRRGKDLASGKAPRSRRERLEAEAAEHEEALAALRERADRHSGHHASAAHEAANRRESTRLEAKRDLPASGSRVAAQVNRDDDIEAVTDKGVQDRVHAWYRAHHPGSGDSASEAVAATGKVTRGTTLAAESAPEADLSPTPRKATAADFAHAAAVQRETIAAARDQQAHQTTADDDNADAESRIPSTAPTERVPAPFVHGNFGTEVASTRSQRPAAPIVRQTPATHEVAAIRLAPPEHVDLKHRGDGLNSALAADRAANAVPPAAAKEAGRDIPVALAADSSPAAIRALAQQTADSPTPTLKLPAPPSGALRKEQPAVAAVESGARRRDLDPAVTSGMAQKTFDSDDTDEDAPAPARTAIALAGGTAPSPVGSLVPTRTHAPAADETETSPANLVSVNLFDRQGKLILVPPMKGSHEILVHQNQMAVADGLDRIQDDGDMLGLRQHKLLVALPDEDSVYPDDRLPANRRYARPWTVRFVRDLAKAHYARFGTPLIVTSAARTVAFQRHLVRVNGNAAPPTGDVASPHLYGQAIDIGKGRMSLTELTWMRAYLTPVENDGKIDVEEEFQQSCFHISVYRRYLGLPAPRRETPTAGATLLTARQSAAPEATKPAERKRRRISTALLATGIR